MIVLPHRFDNFAQNISYHLPNDVTWGVIFDFRVGPIFRLVYLRKYASGGIDLYLTHCCLTLLHLLSLQKLAQNSGTKWQKITQKTATRDC